MKFMWNETKERFNKLMAEKIQEIGYNPNHTDMGSKYYKLVMSYKQKPKK